MKRTILAILCTLALLAGLTACGKQKTVTGKITAIDGTTVTLQLGELSDDEDSYDSSGTPQGEPPAKPDGDNSDSSGAPQGEPPAKPDGDNSDSSGAPQGNPPAKPDGDNSDSSDAPQGNPPEMPDGDSSNFSGAPQGELPELPGGSGTSANFTAGTETLTVELGSATITKNNAAAAVSDLSVGDVVQVELNSKSEAAAVTVVSSGFGAPGGGFGGSGTVQQGSSANTLSEDTTVHGESYASTGDDENALRVDGASVTLEGITVTKSGGASSNTEDGDFYGMNAALLATNGATVTIRNATVSSAAQNGNGVFSYGSGTTVNIADSTITTTADNSGGIQTTGGGTTNATALTISTAGNSSAAIRSDRGGGTVTVTGGTYESSGYNSPAVYSTAAITVQDAVLTAKNSEALVIEGQNSIALTDCTVSGNMSKTNGSSSDENVHTVMIYQSMSGDAAVGTSSFSMTGGSLTGQSGDLFYITNTACTLSLSGVTLENKDSTGNLLTVTGNSASKGWGTAGKNGAQVTATMDGQTLSGAIVVDSISTLSLTLKNGSRFTGTVNITENAQNGTAVSDNAVVTVESGCTWTLTGNCTVTSLTNHGTINYNGYTITLADGTVLQ